MIKSIANLLRFALLDLRRDLKHFWILIACIALGVGTIALVGAIGSSLQDGLARDARQILGGDIEARLTYRPANAEETALLNSLGSVTVAVDLLSRAQGSGEASILASVRGVSENYPLLGAVRTEPAEPLTTLVGERNGTWGAVASPLLIDRLGIAIGDPITLGERTFELRGALLGVPDQASQGLSIGFPLMTAEAALEGTGLLEPGSLARYRYKIVLTPGISFADAAARITGAFPQAGWHISAPDDATEEMARNFELFRRFLSIVGLTALILGGLGVGNAVAAYVNDRQRTIATMKALGATGNRVLGHFLVQVMAMTVVGIVLGTLAAGALTLGALPVLGAMMELALHATIDPRPIFTAAGFGLLIGFLFAYPPLVRALATRPAELFRTLGGTTVRAGRWHYLLQPLFIVPMLLTLLAVLAVALYDTGQPGMVLYYALGVAFAFIVLRAAALLLRGALALLPPPRNVALRSAVRSIRGPASPAAAVILSLGLGMALLLVIAMTEGSLRRQLDPDMRIDAPDFVYLDLFDDEVESFEELARTDPKVKSFTAIPVVRASSFTINGSPPPANVEPPRDISVYFGDERPLSFSSTLPEGSTIASGAWWPPDYTGPPQLSVTDELRESMGLKLGDQITFNIYGETLTTTLTSFRSYDWSRGGVNFPYVLSPGGLDDFPISYFGLLYAAPGAQLPLQRQLVDTHPELVFIPMEEAIDIVRNMVDTIATAISVVGGIALVSGALVIAGALATGRRQREANAVIAKVLGATRGALSGALLIEYALIGALAALVAVALGILGAWLFATHAMGSGFAVDPLLVTAVVLGSLFLTISIGVAMSWTALSARPVAFLRSS